MDTEPFKRTAFLPDAHAPFHDESAFSAAMAFLKVFKPVTVYIMGDWIDFYSLSRFDKNPERMLSLQDDLDATTALIERTRAAAPEAHILYLRGNHEQRLVKYLWTRAEELAGLRCLNFSQLLDFGKLGVEYVPSGIDRHHGIIVKHGNLVRKHSAYTSKGEMDSHGKSGASGHTHRLGVHYKTDDAGMHSWTECGCLCDLTPEYMEGRTSNWQHGLAYGFFSDSRFEIHHTPIINGTLIWNGMEVG